MKIPTTSAADGPLQASCVSSISIPRSYTFNVSTARQPPAGQQPRHFSTKRFVFRLRCLGIPCHRVSKHHTCPTTSSSNQSQTHGLTVWLSVGVHEWRYCSSLSPSSQHLVWSRPLLFDSGRSRNLVACIAQVCPRWDQQDPARSPQPFVIFPREEWSRRCTQFGSEIPYPRDILPRNLTNQPHVFVFRTLSIQPLTTRIIPLLGSQA